MPLGLLKILGLAAWAGIELTREMVKARRIEKELKLKERVKEKENENTKQD